MKLGLVLVFAGVLSSAAGGQTPASRVYASRADLEAHATLLDAAAGSGAYSEVLRGRAREEAAVIRARLEKGDFQVGDRVVIVVENEAELSDTFTINAGPKLQLPVVGDVGVEGVLRAELEPHLTRMLGRFVRDPRLQARSLIRVAVEGAVARPGVQTVPSEGVLSDLLSAAGGAAPTARLDGIQVTRNGRVVLAGVDIETALRVGRTIDQLGLQAGDRLFVPQRRGGLGAVESPLRALTILLSIPFTIIALTQIF